MTSKHAGGKSVPLADSLLGARRIERPQLQDLIVVAVASSVILVIGVVDFLTGIELRIYPLYFLPVSWVAWRRGLLGGLVVAAASTTVWEVSNSLAGRSYAAQWIRFWNIGAQFCAFAVICVLMARLREDVRRETELRRRDPLTGLYNSGAFFELAALEIARARRSRQPLALGFIDVDDFKTINDRHGHAAGDRVLVDLAEALRRSTRRTDLVARVGGDEFVVLWGNADAEAARRAAEACGAAVRSEPGRLAVTLSMGVAAFDSAPPDLEAALAVADRAMYRRKAAGKDGYTIEQVAGPA